jgi:hypothetical protein
VPTQRQCRVGTMNWVGTIVFLNPHLTKPFRE